jgi:hypothetical protein
MADWGLLNTGNTSVSLKPHHDFRPLRVGDGSADVTSVRCIARPTTVVPAVRRRARPGRRAGVAATVVVTSAVLLASTGTAHAAATAVPMGSAEPFAVLAGSGITNTGATTIAGDIGTFPTTTMTVTGSVVLTGTDHRGDSVTQSAKTDLAAAHVDAANQIQDFPIAADLGGTTLTPGVHTAPAGIGITGALTLDGQNLTNPVFVFQAAETLVTAANSQVNLINGVTACDVFWQVGSSTTLGTNSVIRGTIMSHVSSTLTTGATVEGSVLSSIGAVTLDSATIERPACATPTTGGTVTLRGPVDTAGPVVDGPVVDGSDADGPASGQVRQVPVGAVAAGGGGISDAVRRLWSSTL